MFIELTGIDNIVYSYKLDYLLSFSAYGKHTVLVFSWGTPVVLQSYAEVKATIDALK